MSPPKLPTEPPEGDAPDPVPEPGPEHESTVSAITHAAAATTRTVMHAGVRLYQRVLGDLILLLAFLGLVYFLVYFTINSNYARRVFDEVVNGQVFRGSIRWDRITWGPWPSDLRIQKPVLLDSTGKTVVRIEGVDVTLNLLALTEGAIVGEDIIIDSPVIDFHEVPAEDEWGNPSRALNIGAMFLPPQRMPGGGQPGGPPTMRFHVAEIRNARYSMDLPSIGVDCRGLWIEDAFFELRANPAGAGPVSMVMGAHSVQVRDALLVVPKTPGELPASKRSTAETWRWRPRGLVVRDYTWKDWAFRVESVRTRLGGDTVEVHGLNLDLASGHEVSIGGRLALNVQDLGPHLRMFGVDGISGPMVLDMRSGGELMSQTGGGTLEGAGLSLPGGLKIGPWKLNVRHENNRLDIQRLDLTVAGGRLEGHAFLDGERGRALAGLDLTALTPKATGLVALAAAVDSGGPLADLLAARIGGHIDAHLTELWSPERVISASVSLDVERPEGRTSPLPPRTHVEATVVSSGPALDVRHLALETPSDSVRVSGRADLEARTLQAQLAADVGDLSPWAALARLPLKGAVALTGTLSGPWRRPDARVELEARDVSWHGLPTARASLTAHVVNARLDLRTLEVSSGDTQVSLTGKADLSRPDGRFSASGRVDRLDLATWVRGQPVKGLANVELRGAGTLNDPELQVSLNVARAAWSDLPEAEVSAKVQSRGLRHPRITVSGLDVRTAVGELHAEGTLQPFDEGVPAALAVSVRKLDVAALRLPVPVGGLLLADLEISGPLRMPAVRGHVEIDRPHYGTLRLDQIALDGRWANPYVKVDTLRVRGSPAAPSPQNRDYLTVTGASLQLPNLAFEGEVALDRIPLALVNHFVPRPLPLQGTLSAHLVGGGTPQNPAVNGELTLDDAAWDDLDVGDARITVEAADRRVRVDGVLFEDTLIALTVPTTAGQGPSTFTVRFTDLSPESHVGRMKDTGLRTRLTGTLSGGLDLFAPPPYGAFADVELTDLRATQNRLDLVNIEPIRASYRDGDVTLSRLSLQAAGQKLRAEGTLRQHRMLDAHVDGDLDLGLLQGLLAGTFSSVQGQATVGLAVSGPIENPMAEGRVRLARAFLVPRSSVLGSEIELMEPVELWIQSSMEPAMGPEPQERRGNYVVTLPHVLPPPPETPNAPPMPNRMVLRRDDGSLTLTALDVALEQFLPDTLSLRLDADNVSLNVPEVVRATFDADDLRFSMSDMLVPGRTQLFLRGGIYLQRASYTADIMPSNEINQGLTNKLRGVSRTRTVSAFERFPILQHFKVDLRVDGENDIFVRNNISFVALDLEIRPSLRIQGNLYDRADLLESERLRVEGEVSTLPDSSSIIYSGREFEVQSAQVDFGKGDFLDATLIASRPFDSCQGGATSASTTSGPSTGLGNGQKQETVTLDLRYRLATLDTPGVPSLQLSSDSGASAIDVATMVLTGACPAQLTAAASAQPALEAAFTPVLNLIEAPLKQTLDIDLNLTPSGRGALIIEADKALSRRLRLYSYAPVGSEEESTIRRQFGLEYQINNFAFGDLSNQSLGQENNTTGQLILMLNLN